MLNFANGVFRQKTNKFILSSLAPSLLIVVITAYMLKELREENTSVPPVLPGPPLAAHADLYPVKVLNSGKLVVDKGKFMSAVSFFLDNHSPKAVSDLVYFGQQNNVSLLLNRDEQTLYNELISTLSLYNSSFVDDHYEDVFQVYIDIVNGIGKTLEGTKTEIVLHDTRNPLQSVVAIQNPISGRRIGDTTTNFGLELIKNYSVVATRGTINPATIFFV